MAPLPKKTGEETHHDDREVALLGTDSLIQTRARVSKGGSTLAGPPVPEAPTAMLPTAPPHRRDLLADFVHKV